MLLIICLLLRSIQISLSRIKNNESFLKLKLIERLSTIKLLVKKIKRR